MRKVIKWYSGKVVRFWGAILFFLITLSPYHLTTSIASTGASFLKLGVGARALGLGSAYTAVANDVTALHWNPAGLSQLKKKELGAMHAELFADSRYDFFGYAHPTKKGTFGIGAVYLSQGKIERRGENRTQTSDFSASDLAITIGAGKFVKLNTSVGMNLKLIRSQIADRTASGFALDLGGLYSLTALPLTAGLAVQNLGTKMQFLEEGYNLPLTFASGISYPLLKSILVSADLKYQPYDSKTTFAVGGEFSPVSIFSLRAGYLISPSPTPSPAKGRGITSEGLSNLSGLGLGAGFKLGNSVIDYSFTPAGELGNSQRISLTLRF